MKSFQFAAVLLFVSSFALADAARDTRILLGHVPSTKQVRSAEAAVKKGSRQLEMNTYLVGKYVGALESLVLDLSKLGEFEGAAVELSLLIPSIEGYADKSISNDVVKFNDTDSLDAQIAKISAVLVRVEAEIKKDDDRKAQLDQDAEAAKKSLNDRSNQLEEDIKKRLEQAKKDLNNAADDVKKDIPRLKEDGNKFLKKIGVKGKL